MKTKKRYTESEQRAKTHKAMALIKARGLTKRDAAKAVGVTPLTLAKWTKKFTDNDDQVGALDVPPQAVKVNRGEVEGKMLTTSEYINLINENKTLKKLILEFASRHFNNY